MRFSGAAGHGRLDAADLQLAGEHFAIGGVVIDDQHALASDRSRQHRERAGHRMTLLEARGEPECRALCLRDS